LEQLDEARRSLFSSKEEVQKLLEEIGEEQTRRLLEVSSVLGYKTRDVLELVGGMMAITTVGDQ